MKTDKNTQLSGDENFDYEFNSVIQEFVSVKIEPEEFNITNCNYCRCCFKMMEIFETQNPTDSQLLNALMKVTQLNLQPSYLASSFCEECVRDISNFNSFRMLMIMRQNKFLAIIENENFEGLKELHNLTLSNAAHNNMQPVVKLERINIPPIKEEDLNVKDPETSIPIPIKSKSKRRKKASKNQVNKKICPICSVKVVKIVTHILLHHPVFCDYCDFKATDQSRVDKHMEVVHNKRYFCHICGKFLKLRIETHIDMVHKKIKNYFCDLCGHGTFQKNDIICHMWSTHLPKDLKCDECDFLTASDFFLKRHRQRVHNLGIDCSLCGKKFGLQKYLDRHIKRVHKRIRKFKCDICYNKFFNNKSLEGHKLNRHGSRDHICEKCGKGFGSINMLNSHMKSHGEKSHICDFCGKGFVVSESMRKHIDIVHYKIKRFACTVCNKQFSSNSKLAEHKLEHEGIRFPCFAPGCATTHTRKDASIYHLKTVHKLSQEVFKDCKKKLDEFAASLKDMKTT
ncbi:CLUMA_CG012631, isoform A [Clunio marinus]|uniref:CLUMA_CG012631, isoform A n=1 Tax=Clunio marinus TaxID=568069 RepID=A0A1J1ILK1_9DIPT|nr:CLUMA_CG012631, isoform A [Clunio marinus]